MHRKPTGGKRGRKPVPLESRRCIVVNFKIRASEELLIHEARGEDSIGQFFRRAGVEKARLLLNLPPIDI
jgi:hypothetical protein